MRRFSSAIAVLFSVGFAACAVSSSAPEGAQGEASRGPLGKADHLGSCAGDPGEPSFCGGQSDGQCWCDDLCADYGDCCGDKEMVCDASGNDTCLSSAACADGDYCAFESGCGEGPIGTCEAIPEICPQVAAPVCGCDGETYINSCYAAGAGVSVQFQGPCEGEEPASCEGSCGGQADGCWCDELCSQYGDCCEDYEAQCVEEPVDVCEGLIEDFMAETESIRSCSDDAECGQVLTGTSCGCTRNWVARLNADISDWTQLREAAQEEGCAIPGGISTCDCPPALGYECSGGICNWDYL